MTSQTILRRNVFSTMAAMFLGALTLQPVSSQVFSDFTGGNSNMLVDAWEGTPGDGWITSWQTQTNNSTVIDVTTSNANPLVSGGGNYLQFTVTNNHGTAVRSGKVSRQYESYGSVNLAQPHTISFEFRMDTAMSAFDRLYFYDSDVSALASEAAGTTWLIRGNPNGSLVVHDRENTVTATGVTLAQGNVYRFTVNVNPSSVAAESFYTVQINNLTIPEQSYKSDALRFYSEQTSVGGFLNFTGRVPVGEMATFSIDSIHVIPEPSAVAFVSIASLFMLNARRPLSKTK